MAHASDFAGKRARPWSSEQLPSLSLPGKDALPRYSPAYSIDFPHVRGLRCDLSRGAGQDPDAVHDRGRGRGGRGRLAHIVPLLPPSWRGHSHRDGQRSCFQAPRRWVGVNIAPCTSICAWGSLPLSILVPGKGIFFPLAGETMMLMCRSQAWKARAASRFQQRFSCRDR